MLPLEKRRIRNEVVLVTVLTAFVALDSVARMHVIDCKQIKPANHS